jgi:hypothetical protein
MDVAAEFAQRAHALGATVWPTGLSLPEVCLNIHRGLVAGGDSVAAALALERAVRWIEEQAHPNAPADFKDSLLGRNPAHRAVLTGGGRSPHR